MIHIINKPLSRHFYRNKRFMVRKKHHLSHINGKHLRPATLHATGESA